MKYVLESFSLATKDDLLIIHVLALPRLVQDSAVDFLPRYPGQRKATFTYIPITLTAGPGIG